MTFFIDNGAILLLLEVLSVEVKGLLVDTCDSAHDHLKLFNVARLEEIARRLGQEPARACREQIAQQANHSYPVPVIADLPEIDGGYEVDHGIADAPSRAYYRLTMLRHHLHDIDVADVHSYAGEGSLQE